MAANPAPRILVVDDDQATVDTLAFALRHEGFDVRLATSVKAALEKLGKLSIDLVISDLVMPETDGLGFLGIVRERYPQLPFVICTGFGTIPSAIAAIRQGAGDYLTKPINLEQLLLVVERSLKTGRLIAENQELREELKKREGFPEMIGSSPPMLRVFERIKAAAPTDATVLVRGESGTGKELVARAVHRLSARAEGPLVVVNCAAFTDTLIESELFGHEKGAYTGAYTRTRGRVELAGGGTLFLDEVGDLSAAAQSKLLRLLQEKTFERVGGTESLSADIRLVSATHRDLEQLVSEGLFREDLYYRVNVVPLTLPPLRVRGEDRVLLFRAFLAEFAAKYEKAVPVVPRDVQAILDRYDWPGNVRELRNLVESLVIMNQKGRISGDDLPERLQNPEQQPRFDTLLDGSHSLDEIEREVIRRTLARLSGNKAQAAKVLGIGLKTLYRRLNEDDPPTLG